MRQSTIEYHNNQRYVNCPVNGRYLASDPSVKLPLPEIQPPAKQGSKINFTDNLVCWGCNKNCWNWKITEVPGCIEDLEIKPYWEVYPESGWEERVLSFGEYEDEANRRGIKWN